MGMCLVGEQGSLWLREGADKVVGRKVRKLIDGSCWALKAFVRPLAFL